MLLDPGLELTLRPMRRLETREDRRAFLLDLICFAACIEGLFFYGAFAYVYFLRSRGLLHGLASGTNWVFRDESMHMAFAFDVVDTVRAEEPDLFDERMAEQVRAMLAEAVDCETRFAEDLLGAGVPGLPLADMRAYLEHVADRRLAQLGLEPLYGSANPLAFMELQDVQERRTSSSAACRPTRSPSAEASPSTTSSDSCPAGEPVVAPNLRRHHLFALLLIASYCVPLPAESVSPRAGPRCG